MASKATKLVVGIFVTVGMALGIITILWLGTARYFEKGKHYATYFDESVQGLGQDSPVKYRGVSIGRVESVSVAPDMRMIQVVLKIEAQCKLKPEEMVAQLKSIGITGIMFIEINQKIPDDQHLTPEIGFESKYPVIASKPSEIRMFMDGLNEVLATFKAMDIDTIFKKLESTMNKIDEGMTGVDPKQLFMETKAVIGRVNTILQNESWNTIPQSLEDTSVKLNTFAATADETVSTMNRIIKDNESDINKSIHEFAEASSRANGLMGTGANMLQNTESDLMAVQRNLTVVAQNLARASEDLNRLIRIGADQPSQLLFSKPLPPKEIEPDE